MRKLVIATLIVMVVVTAVIIVVSGVQGQRTSEQSNTNANTPSGQAPTSTQSGQAPTSTPSGQAPTPTPSAGSPTTTRSRGKNRHPAKPAPSGGSVTGLNHVTKPNDNLVYAAVADLVAVQRAMFMPSSQMESTIRKYASTGMQTRLINSFQSTGRVMARSWGYSNPTDVLAVSKGGFTIDPDKVRVNFVGNSGASVTVFAIVHWTTADSRTYYVPSLQTVALQKESGSWLYVSSRNPPAGQAPQFTKSDTNKSYDQIYKQYVPYLKGYVTYVPQKH